MALQTAWIFSDDIMGYNFNDDHPMKPLRLRLLSELVSSLELLDADHITKIRPQAAADEDLALAHDYGYIEAVKLLSENPDHVLQSRLAVRHGFASADNPSFAGMHQAAATAVGGTLAGAQAILDGEVTRAFHPGGGFHHAFRNSAAGFCIYNDAVVAIHRFLQAGWRVLYIDGDAHHGDGVEEAFADEPRVLTISLHEDGRFLFPGTGFPDNIGSGPGLGYAANFPLLPGTGDESWRQVVDNSLAALFHAFEPDVIVSQHGCDPHYFDPLTHLNLSTAGLEYFNRCLESLTREVSGGRWLALGGGGYDIWRVVPRAWALLWAAMTGQDVPTFVPLEWLQRWQPLSPYTLPDSMRDDPAEIAALAAAEPGLHWDAAPKPGLGTSHAGIPKAWEANLAMAKQTLDAVLPYLLREVPQKAHGQA